MNDINKNLHNKIQEWLEPKYLSKKASGFSDVPQRTMQSWIEKGLLIPASNPSGTGTKRRFSFINCVEIGIIKSLTNDRLALPLISLMMGFLRDNNTLLTLNKSFENESFKIQGPNLVCALLAKKSFIISHLGLTEAHNGTQIFRDPGIKEWSDRDYREQEFMTSHLVIVDDRFQDSMLDPSVKKGPIIFANDPNVWMQQTMPWQKEGEQMWSTDSVDKIIIIDLRRIAERVSRRMNRYDYLSIRL